MRAGEGLTAWWGAVLIVLAFAFVAAFFTLPARNTWSQRFLNGAVIAGIALGFVMVAAIARHLWCYWRSGRPDENWGTWAYLAVNGACFYLQRKPDAMPVRVQEHGIMEFAVKYPSAAVVRIPDGELLVQSLHGDCLLAMCDGEGPGVYEVRWYGSRKRGKFYEITRATFVLVDGHRTEPEGGSRGTT